MNITCIYAHFRKIKSSGLKCNGYIPRFFIFEGFILGIAAILALFFDRSVFYSVVLGAALVILPQLYFSRKVFRYRDAKFSQAILRDFYTGEAIKMLCTFAGFAVIFTFVRSLNAVAFMLTFTFVQLLFWFAPLLLREPEK